MASPAYYPSFVCNLRVRFDEALHVLERPLPAPASVATIVAAPPSVPGASAVRPLILRGGSDNMTFVMNRVPLSAKVQLAGYRQAHKWSFDLDYRDLPLDPRVVRSIGVELHLGVVAAADFAAGITQTPARGAQRRSILQTRDAAGFMNKDTLILVGVADSITSSFSGGRAVIAMEGRDMRGLFLDPPNVRADLVAQIDLTRPIHKVVAQIMSLHPFGGEITVEVNEDDWPDGVVPSPGAAGDLTRVNLGAAGTNPKVPVAGDANRLTYWDIVTNYCNLVGGIPYFDGATLKVRPAKSIYANIADDNRADFDPRVKAPFKNGSPRELKTDSGNKKIAVRRMVYGRDIEDLSFQRKLQGVKVPVVEVVCLDTSSTQRGQGKLLIARWPDATVKAKRGRGTVQKAKATTVAPSGEAVLSDVLRIPVHGIKDLERLRDIAQSIYEEIGRGEMGGKVTTKDLASFGGDNDDADILRLRPGEPVSLIVDTRALASRPPLETELTEHSRRSFEEEVSEIEKRLGDPNMARVLVACARGQVVELQSYFRVDTVSFSWDAKSGVQSEFDFKNYVEARYGVDADQVNEKAPIKAVAPHA